MSLISRIFSALHDNLNFKTIGLMMVAPSECCNATMMETTVNSDAFRKLQYHSFTNNTEAAHTSAAANQNISSTMAVSPISAVYAAMASEQAAARTADAATRAPVAAAAADTAAANQNITSTMAVSPISAVYAAMASEQAAARTADAATRAPVAAAAADAAAANQNISSTMAVSPISAVYAAMASEQAAVSDAAAESAVARKSSLASMLGNMVAPTERMVRVQLGDSFVASREQAAAPATAPAAPAAVAAAPIMSSYALATMADSKSMTDSELTDCYVKFFSWLEPTQGMIMAHMRLAARDAEMAERAEEQKANSAYVKSRWENIVSALSQDNLTATRNVLMQQTQRKAGFFSRRFNLGSSYLVALGQH